MTTQPQRQATAGSDGSYVVPVGTNVFNPFSIAVNRGLSHFVIPPSSVALLIWQLPRRSNGKYLVKSLTKGWQTTGILTLQKGTPFTVPSGVDNSQNRVGADHADIVGKPYIGQSSKAPQVAGYSNTKAHKVNAVGTFGDSGQHSLIGLGTRLPRVRVIEDLESFRAE